MDNPISKLGAGLEALGIESRQQEAKKTQGELGQEAFLELMITQLNNQNPMEPMENGEFLSQIAQFGTVNGITQLQESFDALASSLQSSQALQASTMVGRSVLLESDYVHLNTENAPIVGVDLPSASGNVKVAVLDPQGQSVRALSLGERPAGYFEFTWDGQDANGERLPAGRYSIVAEAIIDNKPQAVSVYNKALVESVSLPRNGQAPVLNLGDYGAVDITSILRVL